MKKSLLSLSVCTAITVSTSVMTTPQAHADDFVPILSFAAGLLNEGVFPQSDAYTTDDDIVIYAEDGVNLEANIFVPTNLTGLAPAVIFINSWGLNEYEYLAQAADLAENGYIVLSYTTRGFGESGGLIGTAGPLDMSDYSTAIDFLIDNYPVDPNAIGTAGISYGSGISLIGASQDSRVKAVAALSSWGSLVDSLYGNQTPRKVWGSLLNTSSQTSGNPDPIIQQHWEDMIAQNLPALPAAIAWANERSPINYVDGLNQNGTAVYLAKAYGDDLFQANSLMDMYEQLSGDKYIDLVSGTHATAELLPTLVGFGDNRIWENTYAWFDHHLKGEQNEIATAQPVNMKVKFKNQTDSFDSYPIPGIQNQTYFLHPRTVLDTGDLETYPYWSWFGADDTINALTGSLFSTQIPILSQLLEQYEIPTLANVPLSPDSTSIYFESDWLSSPMQIRGEPEVTLRIQPKHDKAQVVAYLYDMDFFGTGTLITHGVMTLPAAEYGKKVTIDMELVTTAYDVPPGHKVVLAIDTQDPQYQRPTTAPYFLDFEFSTNKQNTLTIPVL